MTERIRRGLHLLIGLVCLGVPLAGACAGEAKAAARATGLRLAAGDPSVYRLAPSADFRLAPSYRARTAVSPALAAKPYAKEVDDAARQQGLDPALVHAVIDVESAYNPNAISPKGARGLMQVLPETASRYGNHVRLYAVDDNLRVGTRYLKSLLDMFDQRVDLALAAYNAGEGAIARYGNRIPPYAETREYVPAVMNRYENWRLALPAAREYAPGTRLNPGWQELVSQKAASPIAEGD